VNSAVQCQLTEVRKKLEALDDSMPTVKLDPTKVRATRFGGRHESAFKSRLFQSLKELIRHSKGNIQPILVRRVPGGGYEIVFGHRRHRACLELGLPVLAVIWQGEMSDADLFAAMDAENRGRRNPSAFDQGMAYAAALAKPAPLFLSARQLAEAIGVSHTWVNKALMVAKLHKAVLGAFDDPGQIQPAHAKQVAAALKVDRKAVLRRAAVLSSSAAGLKPGDVVNELLGRAPVETTATPLRYGRRLLGTWVRDAKGRAVLTLQPELSTPAHIQQFEALFGWPLAANEMET
jgi:ParB family chromosome partitioning protein